jgi:predicted Zn-dependent protease
VIRHTSGAIAIGYTSFNTYYLKSLSEIQMGRTDSGIRTLQAALRLHPDSNVFRRLLAAQLFEAGAYPEANAYYESFAREDSGNVEAWLKFARIASFRQ